MVSLLHLLLLTDLPPAGPHPADMNTLMLTIVTNRPVLGHLLLFISLTLSAADTCYFNTYKKNIIYSFARKEGERFRKVLTHYCSAVV